MIVTAEAAKDVGKSCKYYPIFNIDKVVKKPFSPQRAQRKPLLFQSAFLRVSAPLR